MGPKEVVAGSTDVSVVIRIMDSSDGTPETGLAVSQAGLSLSYWREGASSTTLIAQAAGTPGTDITLGAAHTDGGFEEIGNGYYRLDVQDAAWEFGVDSVSIVGTVTDMVVYGPTIRLLDPINKLFASQTVGATGNDTTHFHAPSWTYGDDEINGYAAVVYDDSEDEPHVVRITDWVNSTKLATFTPALPASVEASTDLVALLGKLDDRVADILTDTAEIGTAGAGLTEAGGTGDQLTAVPWNSAWDAEVQSEATDALNAYDPPTRAELTSDIGGLDTKIDTIDTNVDTLLTRITSSLFSGITSMAEWLGAIAGKQTPDATAQTELRATGAGSGSYDATTDSQEAIRDRGDAAWAGTGATAGEIADAVWDEATSGHTTASTFGKAVADILADTNELQSDDVPGLIAALNDPSAASIADAIWDEAQADHTTAGTFGEIATEIASILADTNELQTDDVPGLIAALNDVSTADVNAQLVDVLSTDTQSLPGQEAPSATPTLAVAIMYLYKAWRNKSEQTSSAHTLYADDGSTADQTRTVADDGTTFTAGEMGSGA